MEGGAQFYSSVHCSLNLVDSNLSEVWRPVVVLLNTVDITHSALTDTAPSLTYVVRRGDPTGTDNSVPEEGRSGLTNHWHYKTGQIRSGELSIAVKLEIGFIFIIVTHVALGQGS